MRRLPSASYAYCVVPRFGVVDVPCVTDIRRPAWSYALVTTSPFA